MKHRALFRKAFSSGCRLPVLLLTALDEVPGVGAVFRGRQSVSSMQLQKCLPARSIATAKKVERRYEVLDTHLKGRELIVGSDYAIPEISAWAWLNRAPRVLSGDCRRQSAVWTRK